jgi:hypothetical protein
MDALRQNIAAPAPAWVEVPHEFIDEFFHTETGPESGERIERRPELGIAICVGLVGLFWGSAAILLL